jgi:hypothetical protein
MRTMPMSWRQAAEHLPRGKHYLVIATIVCADVHQPDHSTFLVSGECERLGCPLSVAALPPVEPDAVLAAGSDCAVGRDAAARQMAGGRDPQPARHERGIHRAKRPRCDENNTALVELPPGQVAMMPSGACPSTSSSGRARRVAIGAAFRRIPFATFGPKTDASRNRRTEDGSEQAP